MNPLFLLFGMLGAGMGLFAFGGNRSEDQVTEAVLDPQDDDVEVETPSEQDGEDAWDDPSGEDGTDDPIAGEPLPETPAEPVLSESPEAGDVVTEPPEPVVAEQEEDVVAPAPAPQPTVGADEPDTPEDPGWAEGESDRSELPPIAAAARELPSVDPADYDNVIMGKTFNSTLRLDEGDDNTLIIGCKFVGIDGHGIDLRNVSNVTIHDNVFEDIEGTAVRFRSSGSTEDCTVTSNTFDGIRENAISAAKRSGDDVDHKGLIIHDNDIGDTGSIGNQTAHAIYVQTSGVVVSSNTIIGQVDANGISIRGDGIVVDNYIDIETTDDYGSGLKYYADHMTGDSKELIIANNTVMGNDSLYSGIELKSVYSAIPSGIEPQDWIVNDFLIAGNRVMDVEKDYLVDSGIRNQTWANVEFRDTFEDVAGLFAADGEDLLLSDMLPETDAGEMPDEEEFGDDGYPLVS